MDSYLQNPFLIRFPTLFWPPPIMFPAIVCAIYHKKTISQFGVMPLLWNPDHIFYMVKNGHRVSKFGPRDQKSLLTPPQNWWKHSLNHNKQLLKRPGVGTKHFLEIWGQNWKKGLFLADFQKISKNPVFWRFWSRISKIRFWFGFRPFFDPHKNVSGYRLRYFSQKNYKPVWSYAPFMKPRPGVQRNFIGVKIVIGSRNLDLGTKNL